MMESAWASTYSMSGSSTTVLLVSELLRLGTDPHTVANLIDTNLFEHCLVEVEEIFASDVVCCDRD